MNKHFTAVLGKKSAIGLLDQDTRLAQIKHGDNPYKFGAALCANHPTFIDRKTLMHRVMSQIRQKRKPSCVSLLGERRIGKTSLLNQLCAKLSAEEGMIHIFTTPHDWNEAIDPATFYLGLHGAICRAIGHPYDSSVNNYMAFRDFLHQLSSHYRFLMVIDEFEDMAKSPQFDEQFFSNLRQLGETSLGFLTSSRCSLVSLCHQNTIQSSRFWNIFNCRHVGLLTDQARTDLINEPLKRLGLNIPQSAQDKIVEYAGNHPAFIQICLNEIIMAEQCDDTPEWMSVRSNIHQHMRDQFLSRTTDEWALLVKIAAGKRVGDSSIRDELMQRGLLNRQMQLFAPYFQQVMKELLPSGKTMAQVVNDIESGGEHAKKWFKTLLEVADMTGQVVNKVKGIAASDEEP